MNNKESVWTFRRRMVLLLGSGVIVFLVYLAVRYLFVLASPFIIAYGIALVIEKPVNALAKVFRGKKALASTLIVTGLTIIIAAAVFYITWLGVAEIKSFIANFEYLFIMVRQKTAGICLDVDGMLGLSDGCSLEFVCSCADRIRRIFRNGQPEEVVSSVLRISFPILVNTAVIAGAVIVCLISVVYLSGVLEKVRKWRENSIFREEVCALTLELKKLIQVYFKIELIIMLINAGICIAGLLLIHNPYAVVIGILIGLVDALPFFGTGTVLIPWAVILLLFRNYYAGAVLLSVYVMTYFVREIMESKCMGDRLGIAPFTMLMVIFTGIMVYGILGFILGPLSYCMMKALIRYFASVLENAGGTWYT
ncbi:MAG: AI-2E family transporter [Lachnospira sp.]|jgi:predicted PurR-regulated permease PerM|uniref:AI-2E family transporter n=1 Tax=Lachnospira pectinoschiza TaxID=28052 RepID=UPI001B146028|nr:AI-2E family transporter [Lachnospira pectinoschiza]MBO6143500.1 AI-2E family transporter [Lachnospira sp.]MBP8835745.1 AI-2E family transporter [Lachnospira sp.]MCB6142684.1 AI-2E family transporter [Lachnospira pectinoschiza]